MLHIRIRICKTSRRHVLQPVSAFSLGGHWAETVHSTGEVEEKAQSCNRNRDKGVLHVFAKVNPSHGTHMALNE